MLKNITDDTFRAEVLGAERPVLVDFWAEWCPPCRALNPVLEALASEYPQVEIVKVNADDNPQTAAAYRVTGLPTMAVFRDGELVTTLRGAHGRPALERILAGVLS